MSETDGHGALRKRAAVGPLEPGGPRADACATGGRAGEDWPASIADWARAAPVALALLDADGVVAQANSAFEVLVGRPGCAGCRLDTVLACETAAEWAHAGPATRRALRCADGRHLACDVHCAELAVAGGRRLLTLVQRGPEAESTVATRESSARERLDFVQARTGIGFWERDVRTRVGHWDRHMYEFFGLDPARGTPSIAQSAQASMPQDMLQQTLEESMRTPGVYSHVYRLLRSDGTIRQVRAHWQVLADAAGEPERMLGFVIDDPQSFGLARPRDEEGAQLQIAAELADLAIWRHDLTTNWVQFNDCAWRMLGLVPRPQGIAVAEVRAMMHPDDMPEVMRTFSRTLHSGHPEDMQARYRHADGRWRTIFTRRIAQRDAFGTPVALCGVGLDITEQVERLRRSDELARQLDEVTAASGIGLWRIWRDGGSAEWNKQMYALCGLPDDQPPPPFHDWVDRCVHPDDRVRVRRHGAHWLREGTAPDELAHRLVLPDGRVRHVVARGRVEPEPSPFRFTGVTIDVTERETALAAMRAATERAAIATRAAGLGIWEWDMDTGISRWDAQMFALRGVSPDQPSPTLEAMAKYVHPDDLAFVNDQIHSARIEDRVAYYEFRIVRPDGEVRWLASRSQPVRDDEGRTHLRLGVNWDITDAHAAAEARHERALVLRESQAKSELLARMSHELRTPMNAVLGFTRLLLADEQAPGDARARERLARLQHIDAAGEHLLALINDVLELSRIDAVEPRDVVLAPVRIATTLAQSLPLVERLAHEHRVRIDAQPSGLWVRADPTRMTQVVVNLLSNAIKYNRPGGCVRFEVAEIDRRVRLRVADDGVGLTAEQQAQVFEPFNRVGAEGGDVEGTGIGLTIVKALVEGMGGRIEVHSAPGEGSIFDVWLEPAVAPGAPAAPGRRVLYVEDNAVNVMIVSELVRRRGDLLFDSVPDGASGVARAAQTLPGLVLVDMQLPDIDGLEVLARLRANPATSALRVIALSANAIPADIQRALEAGFDDYWTKPLDFSVLNAALDRVFGPVIRGDEPAN